METTQILNENRQMIEHLKEYKLEKDGRLLTDGELNRLIEIVENRNIFGEKQVIIKK